MEKRVAAYAERASGAVYWDPTDRRGLSPLDLVRQAAARHPGLFRAPLQRLLKLDRTRVVAIVDRVPGDWMTQMAREFVAELVGYTLEQLQAISV